MLPVALVQVLALPVAAEVEPLQKRDRESRDSGSPKPHPGSGSAAWLLNGVPGTALTRGLAMSQLLLAGLSSPDH